MLTYLGIARLHQERLPFDGPKRPASERRALRGYLAIRIALLQRRNSDGALGRAIRIHSPLVQERLGPERPGSAEQVDPRRLPPEALVANAVDGTVMVAAEWERKFIAGLAAKHPWLRVAQVVRIRGLAAADEAGLLDDVPVVVLIAIAARFGNRQRVLIDTTCGADIGAFL